MLIESELRRGGAHLGVDPAAAAELGGGGDELPAELGGEDAPDLLQLRQVPAPRGGVHEPRRRLPQLLGALPARVDERRPLGDEAAVGLEVGERVERVLLPDGVLGARQRAVGAAQAEQLLDVPARAARTAPGGGPAPRPGASPPAPAATGAAPSASSSAPAARPAASPSPSTELESNRRLPPPIVLWSGPVCLRRPGGFALVFYTTPVGWQALARAVWKRGREAARDASN